MADYGLTERELDILELIGTGAGNQEIADALFLSVNTVKSYVRTAYRKLCVTTRPQAVLWVLTHHVTPAESPTSMSSRPGTPS